VIPAGFVLSLMPVAAAASAVEPFTSLGAGVETSAKLAEVFFGRPPFRASGFVSGSSSSISLLR
jgi:hypothetical protein